MNKIKLLVLAGLFAIATMPAQAAVDHHQVSVYGGGSGLLTDRSIGETPDKIKIGDFGVAFGAQYLAHFNPYFGIGLDAMFNLFSEAEEMIEGTKVTSNPTNWTLMAVVRSVFLPEAKVRPYMLAGVGLSFLNYEFDVEGESFTLDESETGYAVCLGFGAEMQLGASGNFFAGIEGRWTQISNSVDIEDEYDFLTHLFVEDYSYYSILAKFAMKFGAK